MLWHVHACFALQQLVVHILYIAFLPRTLGEWLMQSMAVQFLCTYVDWRLSFIAKRHSIHFLYIHNVLLYIVQHN